MEQNVNPFDRLVRLSLAVLFALALLDPSLHHVPLAWWLLPGALFITGLVGYCPLYSLVRLLTHRLW